MREREFLQCQHFNCLLDDGVTNQSIPIVLPISTADKEKLGGNFFNLPKLDFDDFELLIIEINSDCEKFALKYKGKTVAVLSNPEIYEHRKEERVARQFGTTNQGHPYIKVLLNLNKDFWKYSNQPSGLYYFVLPRLLKRARFYCKVQKSCRVRPL